MTGVLIMRFLLPLLLALSLFLPGCGQAVPAEPSEGPPAGKAEKSDLIPTPDPEPPPASVPVPEPLPEPAPEDLVLVTDYVPGIQVDLKYAGEDNFTGQVI